MEVNNLLINLRFMRVAGTKYAVQSTYFQMHN